MARRLAQLVTVTASVAAMAVGGLGLAAAVPAAPGDLSVHLAAAGDFAAGADAQAVLAAIGAADPDATLALGDLSYGATGEEQAWCDLVTSRVGAGSAFELLAGNHESNGQNGNINDFSACLPNQLPGLVGTYGRQWYVDVPAEAPLVRLVMISPALPFPEGTYQYTAGSPRLAWTAAAIDGARSAQIPWVVVGMHKPCLSLGEYGCDIGTDLMSLLVDRKVDLVLTGHEHLYQRTAQLSTGPGCAAVLPGGVDPDCIVDAGTELERGAGTVFVTVGTGGQAQRPVHTTDPEAGYFVSASGQATATWGFLDLQVTGTTLTAGFVRASGGTFADAFTLTDAGSPPNQAPVAAATATCDALTCTFDGTGSSDADGTVASWSWSFGDATSGTGASVAHTYGSAGTYQATLTVTDDAGAVGSTTVQVAPTAPVGFPFAADAFGRTTTSGFSTADTGGAWLTAGSATSYAVTGGVGVMRLTTAGVSRDASLPAVSSAATDLVVAVGLDKPATGGGVYVAVAGRRVAGVGEYRATLRLRSGGVVALGLARTAGTAETTLIAPGVVSGLMHTAGEQLLVRVQVTGTSPTTLRAKVWRVGTTEPSAWQVTTTDATAGLQTSGAVGLNAYLSSSATNAPVAVRLDDLVATTP